MHKELICLYIICFAIGLFSCNEETSKSSSIIELNSIDLLRGDLVLCSGNSFGDVRFSLSCKYSARESFDIAVALLHSFEYQEAEKAFVKVLDIDPECAMAYWGVAMSIYHAAWFPPTSKELVKASQIIEIGSGKVKSTRERDYLDAISSYYTNWQNESHTIRASRYEAKMARLYEKYKDDSEAAIFYALALYSTRDRSGNEYTNEMRAGEILESIFPDQPNHPGIAHYLIHNYDNPKLAKLALPTARKYAQIAPSSAHAQHMPSHIFTRLGLWNESINSNIRSMEAAQCYAEETGIEGMKSEEVHAMDYLVYAYAQQSKWNKANDQYTRLKKVSNLDINTSSSPYNFLAIPARMYLEKKDWEGAANLRIQPSNIVLKDHPWEASLVYFTKAMGSIHLADFDSANKQLNLLQQSYEELLKSDKQYEANQVKVQITTALAWLDLFNDKYESAASLMIEAAELEDLIGKHPITPGEVIPARELLGELYLKADLPMEALESYEASLDSRPGRFNSLYGAFNSSFKIGNIQKSKQYFKLMLDLVSNSEGERTELTDARELMKSL